MDAHTGIDPTPSNFDRAAAVCIFHKGSICLGRRPEKCLITGNPTAFAGYWSAFGGALDEEENPMVGAVRELEEETQIKINPFDLVYMCELNNQDGCSYVLYVYHSPELILPTLNFEHTECGYFKIDSLNHSPSPICPKLVQSIFSYEKRRWKG